MKPILSLVLSTFLCAAALDAQTKPCFAMNDTNTNVSSVITLLAFAGPGQWAYQFTPASSLIVRGMRFYTGNKFQNAFMSLEVWSHDAAKKLPKARLAGGTWKNPKPTAIGWYGTNFDKAQALIKGTTYWLVWTDPGWSTPPIDPNSFNTMPYAQRFGTTAAFVAGSNQALKFRLYCSPIDVKGARVFGSSCASAAGHHRYRLHQHVTNRRQRQFPYRGHRSAERRDDLPRAWREQQVVEPQPARSGLLPEHGLARSVHRQDRDG